MELVSTADNPIPAGAIIGGFAGQGGVPIRYARWQPEGERLRGTVCLFPGRGEFIEKYFETVGDLRRRGFAVAIMDWRGQGGSGRLLPNPRKGFVDSFDDYDEDLARFMTRIVLPDCPPPYFALAHSMGANILLRAARSRMVWFERLVLVSPLILLKEGFFPQGVIYRLTEFLTFLGFGGSYLPLGGDTPLDTRPFKWSRHTSDPVRHARNGGVCEQAPALALGSATIQWVYAACQSMAELAVPDFPQKVALPILILGGTRDSLVSIRAMEQLAREVRIGSFLMIPGARHEILMERDVFREQFWAAFDAFVPGTPAFGRSRD